jgi:hypothetical protein
MRKKTGGTNMFCPHCCNVRTCASIPGKWGEGQSRQVHDIDCFHRHRKCLTCGKSFETAEVDKELLAELAELRQLKYRVAWLSDDRKATREGLQRVIKQLNKLTKFVK